MKKTLKVTQAICPCCHFRKPLENSDHYFQHILLGCKLPSGETVNWICVGSGMKASRFALRQERKRLRDIDTIERRHVEMQRKRQELAAEARMLSQIAANAICDLLIAYDLWSSIPPRRKFTIRNMVKRLYSEGANLIVEMKNRTKANKGLQAIVQSLVDQIQRRQSAL